MRFAALKTCLSFFLVSTLFSVNGQRNGIVRALAFSQEINSGARAVDENGNSGTGVKTRICIYLECVDARQPVILSLLYHGTVIHDRSVLSAGNKKIDVGVSSESGRIITLRPAKGNTVWKIEFTLPPDLQKRENTAGIIIHGSKNGKTFIVTIKRVSELAPWVGM